MEPNADQGGQKKIARKKHWPISSKEMMGLPDWFYPEVQDCAFRITQWYDMTEIGRRTSVARGMSQDRPILFAVRSGRVRVFQKKDEIDLAVGDVGLIPSGAPFRTRALSAKAQLARFPIEVIHAKAKPTFLLRKLNLPAVVQVTDRDRYDTHMRWMFKTASKHRKRTHSECLKGNLILNELLFEFWINGFEQGILHEDGGVPRWLWEARDLIGRRHKEHNLRVTTIAKFVNCSTWKLQQGFQEHFGSTVNEYLQQERINTAAKVLSHNPDIKMEALIQRCGYRSRSLFYRMFQRHMGTTPAAFRNQ